ncbi:hypothetical protein ACN6LL_004856, partial [Streptomyces violaceoruber]
RVGHLVGAQGAAAEGAAPLEGLDEHVRRIVLVAVETADTLVQLAFRVAPDGDEKIIEEARELLRAYLGRVLD